MLGRALLRFPVPSRVSRSVVFHPRHDLTARSWTPAVLVLRTYATPGRPKSVVGEPSRPVKRAVKKAAAKPATGDSDAEKQVPARKKIAAGKKTPAKKTPAKGKTLTPTQAAAKKDAAAAKKAQLNLRKAAKQKTKKLQADKLKATEQVRKEKDKLRAERQKCVELKKAALDPPKPSHRNAYAIFTGEKMKLRIEARGRIAYPENLAMISSSAHEIAAEWKTLSPSEIEHYNYLARTKNEAARAEYQRWVESHTVEEMRRANLARAQLRRKFPTEKHKKSEWAPIKDERGVRQPGNSFLWFNKERHASGDLKNIPFSEASKLVAQEWRVLSEDEKTKYQTLFQQELDRYKSEYSEVYGHPPPIAPQVSPPEATSAAA